MYQKRSSFGKEIILGFFPRIAKEIHNDFHRMAHSFWNFLWMNEPTLHRTSKGLEHFH